MKGRSPVPKVTLVDNYDSFTWNLFHDLGALGADVPVVSNDAASADQILAGQLVGAAVGALSGVRYTDMCALRALRVETLAGLRMREMGYGWNLEMQMRAALTGLRVREIPVPYRNRIAGVSKVAGNLRGSLRAGTRIVQVLARVAVEARRERSISAG